MFAKPIGLQSGQARRQKMQNTKIEKNEREMMKQPHNKYTRAHTYLYKHTTGCATKAIEPIA